MRALRLATILLLFAGCGGDPESAPAPARGPVRVGSPPRPPNVLLISVDTLRADRVGSYGHDRPTTPQIDALAAGGMIFEAAYSHSPKTAISHMSLMTGLHPEAHGVIQMGEPTTARLSEDIPTLARQLSEAGYRTVAVASGGHVNAKLGFDQGVDRFRTRGQVPLMVDAAIDELERLRSRRAVRPFFMFLHTYSAHDPYAPPEPHRSLFADPDYAGRILADRDLLFREGGEEWSDRHAFYWSRVDKESPADVQHLLDLYDGAIHWVDSELGRLFAHMRETGLMQQTIVVLLSDHGEAFSDHDTFLHDQVYQEQLHVPLIFRLPDSAAGGWKGREASVVRLVDVLPTLLELTGAPAPPQLDGVSLVPLLEGRGVEERTVMSSWRKLGRQAYRKGSWKLVRTTFPNGNVRRELYDIEADPQESNNLAYARFAITEDLERELDEGTTRAEGFQAAVGRGDLTEIDPETEARLRELGYLK